MRRRALLAGTGLGLLAWGISDARLTFGAMARPTSPSSSTAPETFERGSRASSERATATVA